LTLLRAEEKLNLTSEITVEFAREFIFP